MIIFTMSIAAPIVNITVQQKLFYNYLTNHETFLPNFHGVYVHYGVMIVLFLL